MKKLELALFTSCLLWACSGSTPDAGAGADAGQAADSGQLADSGSSPDVGEAEDAGLEDAGAPPPGYAHVPPPAGEVAEALRGATWRTHFEEDILPYWTMPDAVGTPEGNFPTYRGMDGTVQSPSERRPRMIARQTYAYAVGYMLTGQPRLLELAHAGARWIMDHAEDEARGGWHARLTADGDPAGNDPKTAQDTAYCMLGLGAYFFVTRDPEVEAVILETRDLLFSEVYWSERFGRIKDAVSADLQTEVDVENDGGAELVAQLDPINAFLLLVQPVLTEQSRREQFLGDLRRLAEVMRDDFFADGVFWGVHNKQGQYRSKHADFGHTLKAYWMILEIDKRLPDHPFQNFLLDNVHGQVDLAYDQTYNVWSKRLISPSQTERGSDWWIYAESDQIAATLNLYDGRYTAQLARTADGWLRYYVDDFGASAGEVIPGITRTGSRVYNWPAGDTAKCNLWKNGYHSSEHALVLYLTGRYLEDGAATLHFAVPEVDAQSAPVRPYFFHGTESARTPGDTFMVGGRTLRAVAVDFVDLY